MRSYLHLIACIFIANMCFAQSKIPYEINLKKDGLLMAGSLVLGGMELSLNNSLKPLTEAELNELDANNINTFDRPAIKNWSEAAARSSDIALIGTPLLAGGEVVLMSSLNTRKPDQHFWQDFFTLGIILFEINAYTYSLTEVVKAGSQRTRPYAYNADAPHEIKLEADTRKSFFSGHTSITAANSFFMAKVFSDYYPNSKLKPLVWTGAALLPAWTGLERYRAGKHFPSDIMAGYAAGALFGILIPQLHLKKERPNSTSFHIMPLQYATFTGFEARFVF